MWIGILIFRKPEAWGFYLQSQAIDLLPIPSREVMIETVLLDISIGVLFLIDVLTWTAALLGAIHLMIVLITSGINAIAVRNIGLLAAFITLAISTRANNLHF